MFSQDFQVDAIEKFISEASIPIVTIFNKDPSNYDYVNKFFDSSNDKVLSFVFPFPLFVCIYIYLCYFYVMACMSKYLFSFPSFFPPQPMLGY